LVEQLSRTVWILGSGFSKSLGGPLLDDLFSDATNALVDAVYSNKAWAPHSGQADTFATSAVRALFREYGPVPRRPSHQHQRLWSDAEEFLDYVDAAAQGGPTQAYLDGLVSGGGGSTNMEDLRQGARRLVAAACCAFLRSSIPTQERWGPYRSWAQKLGRWDGVVTFNYDRVLELLTPKFDFFDPSTSEEPNGTRPLVFKMHGSVDWKRGKQKDGGGVVYSLGRTNSDSGAPVDPEFALNCPGDEIGIATPGPTKQISTKELVHVWNQALEWIRNASVIVFVGYRFPPSDAEAREKLLGAIRENTSRHLALHIVLGPKQQADDIVRLEQLLKYTAWQAKRSENPVTITDHSFWLKKHALYAEDFFTVWSPELLMPHEHLL
jgi:hypothetical protein